MIDIFKDYIGKKVRLTLRNGREYVGPLSHLPEAEYPYYIRAKFGNIMSFKPNGCFLVDSHTGKYDVMRIEPVEKDIFKDFVGKKVRATQKSGEERVGTVHPCPGDCYPYVITYEEEDPVSYKSDGRYWRGGSSLDIVKLELVEEPKPEEKDIFKDFLGKRVVGTRVNLKPIVGVVKLSAQGEPYPYVIHEEGGYITSFTANGQYLRDPSPRDIIELKLAEEEKDIFKEFLGKKVVATRKSGQKIVGIVGLNPGSGYAYKITEEVGTYASYTPKGHYWVGDCPSDRDLVKLELVKDPEPDKNIFRDFLGKKVVATQRDGEKIAGVVGFNSWSGSYPYILTKHDGSQSTYTPEGWYWKGDINNDPDIVKLELAEEPEPEGKWGQVLLRSGGFGIEWKNPVEGKEEELLRVLRDCYGFYPNAEDYAVNRIKAIWE